MKNTITMSYFKFTIRTAWKKSLQVVLPVVALCTVGQLQAAPLQNPIQDSIEQTAEKIKVQGTVKDESGESIIGASIHVKGTTLGTLTDLQGNFTLENVPVNALIEISYVGYKVHDFKAKAGQTYSITLLEDAQLMDEVVVTALGIKRETKSLGYAVQDLKGDALTEAREGNVVNSLTGKLAGVRISPSGNGATGSSRIVIRGENSIAGNNEPLVVVDGIPMDNFKGSGIDQWGGSDGGNGLSDINPDDIESISVLKGAAAAALYGTRAGNGVLMITTKQGTKTKGIGVTYNSNLMIETPLLKPEMQNAYGQGTAGEFHENSNFSWGPKMEGQEITDWTGQKRPFSAADNDIFDYLRNGVSTTNTIGVSSSTEKYNFRGTLSYQNINGVIPTNSQNKYVLNLRTLVNLNSKLKLDTKINYIKQKEHNLPNLTGHPESPMANYLMMPRSVHYSDLKGGVDENGNVKRWTTDEANYVLNPYYGNLFNQRNNKRDRFIGFISLDYTPTNWLTIKLRHGEDMYWSAYDWRHSSGTPYGKFSNQGDYGKGTNDFRERNTDFLFIASQNNVADSKFSGSISFGGNMMYREHNYYGMTSGLLAIPDFFAISNGETPFPTNSLNKKKINSLYGLAQFSYDNWAFLDITGRNDWSSTLSKSNRSFFYPSVGLGWVVTDMLHSFDVNLPSALNFGKLRASYAEVGNDTNPYTLLSTYRITTISEGIKGAEPSSQFPLYDLKPEKIKSYALGFDLRFFMNRLGIDFTWYKKEATNQILSLPVSSTTGKMSRRINAGSIENKGVELVITGKPIVTKDFSWDVMMNFTKNRNKIKELHPELDKFQLMSTDFAKIYAVEQGVYGDIYGKRFKRDDQDQVLVDDEGLPIVDDEFVQIGNSTPKWQGSLMNTFNYKNFSFSFMLDMQYGGDIYVNSLSRGALYGTTKQTLAGRDDFYAGKGGIVVDGVTANGEKNTKAVNPQAYWNRAYRASDHFLYDATNLRLREIILGYTLPKKHLDKTPFTNLKLSFVGRNLWLIKNNVKGGFDPESSFSTGNAQGIEYASLPSMRSFGFNLNLAF